MGFLLDVGADIDQRNNNGCTAMYVAAQNGNVQGLRLLVSRGGDIHLAKNNGAWPAFIACQTGHRK
jgi:ankyrin repeat protein